jgi:hypothetical protein
MIVLLCFGRGEAGAVGDVGEEIGRFDMGRSRLLDFTQEDMMLRGLL